MIKRPKPGDDEAEILKMQEEFLKEKSKNQNYQPAAQVVNLRRTEPTKRATTSEPGTRKPSKYAQSKGLKSHSEKRVRFDDTSSSFIVGDILEKNVEDEKHDNEPQVEDDNVYFPKVIPSLLGNIVEKNLDKSVDLNFPVPSQGFPVATKRDPNNKPTCKVLNTQGLNKITREPISMEIDEPGTSKIGLPGGSKHINLPEKSYILLSKDANDIHNENIKKLNEMSEQDILDEQQKLLSALDPKIVAFLKTKRSNKHCDVKESKVPGNTSSVEMQIEDTKSNKVVRNQEMDTSDTQQEKLYDDNLWDNDVLSHPSVNKWLHFDSLEKDKLEWIKGIEESKKIKPDEPYEARFDFKGYLLPYSIEYTEENKSLFHHGEESHRPGYSLTELFELTRSTITQQRVMALNTLAGILEYHSVGTYKNIIEIPLSKIFFVIRIAMDENKVITLEPALKAMRNLLYNRIDEACLDALIGFQEGEQQPCLVNDKTEMEELESKESEFTDYHLAEIDIIATLLRTDILQRLFYILDSVKPSFNCVQYALQILIRLARDSVETATKIVETEHLMETIIRNFVPITGVNFAFDPHFVYNGKPVLAAIKLFRVLSLQSHEISKMLVTKYNILRPISEYISSGVDGTYGLRIQIEATCIVSNLIHYDVGTDDAASMSPIISTTLYKHVQGTDIYVDSSVISATHAAVVLLFVNKLLNSRTISLDNYKQQFYPLIRDGAQKWLAQLSRSNTFTCAHLRLLCAVLDCCTTIVVAENVSMKFLNDSLKILATSKGFKEVLKNVVPNSNLLSDIDTQNIHYSKNLISIGGSLVDAAQKVLPILNMTSPFPFLASLSNLLAYINNADLSTMFLTNTSIYLKKIASKTPSLCDNWFTRIETDFILNLLKLSSQTNIPESEKDVIYAVANKMCYILRVDKKSELEYLFNNILFNKDWFTAERLMNLVSLTDANGFSKALSAIQDIKLCYQKVINLNYRDTGPNIVLKKWKEPILPRDWIYLPILTLYGKSQETDRTPAVIGDHAKKIATKIQAEKELIISSSLEWILFNELCFPDLLTDIDTTDRLCRIMCVFLCDNSLFLDPKINTLLRKCVQVLFKKKTDFNFDKQLIGLHNFQDFYTQFLEQFQSVSYGDHTFAACVLVPLAQKHNVKWRKLLWSEYAGCLRALHCPEEVLCYEINNYFYPEEQDESLIRSYFQALSGNLLRVNTIAFRIAEHHVKAFKERTKGYSR